MKQVRPTQTPEQIGSLILATLEDHNQRRRQVACEYQSILRLALAAHPGWESLSGPNVRALLKASPILKDRPLVSLRRLQEYLKAWRAPPSASRVDLSHDRFHDQPTHTLAPSLRPAAELLVTATRPILSLRPPPQSEADYHRQAPILRPTLTPPAYGAMPNRHSDATVTETPAQRLARMLQQLGAQRS